MYSIEHLNAHCNSALTNYKRRSRCQVVTERLKTVKHHNGKERRVKPKAKRSFDVSRSAWPHVLVRERDEYDGPQLVRTE